MYSNFKLLTLVIIIYLEQSRTLHNITSRQFPYIGKYITIFHDVLDTFLKVLVVLLIIVFGFAIGFHILLSHKQEFQNPGSSMLKTLVMMSGEMEYTDIFHGEEGMVPYPQITYMLFVVFFFLLSIVTLNLLVGLTVDDIKEFLDEAEFKNLKLKVTWLKLYTNEL